MAYSNTTRLGLKKAVVGSNQAFETAVFNENLDDIDAGFVSLDSSFTTIDGRLDNVEASSTGNSNAIVTLQGRVTAAEGDIDSLQASVAALGAGTSVRTVSGTTDTLVTGDRNNIVVYTSTADVAVTVPNVLTPGQRIDIVQDGDGKVTLNAGSGVAIYGVGVKTSTRFAGATILCVASGSYRLIGNIVP